jgi:hypothetical protein
VNETALERELFFVRLTHSLPVMPADYLVTQENGEEYKTKRKTPAEPEFYIRKKVLRFA